LKKSLKRALAVAWIESLHVLRDKTTLALLLAIPAIQMALFGYAINPLPQHVPLVIAGGPVEEQVTEVIQSLKIFSILNDHLPPGGAEQAVRDRKALIGIEIPKRSDPSSDEMTTVYVDDSDPALSVPALSALENGYLQAQADEADLPNHFEIKPLYNPDNRHDWSVMPGLAGVVVMISMLMLGALSLVREREQGTWEALLATPVNAVEALFGKLTPYLLLGVLQAFIVLMAGWLLFQLPLHSTYYYLIPFTALYALSHLCVGFAISAMAKRQLQAIQGSVFFYLPSMLLSGFLYPFANMPEWAQAIGNCLPLTHFIKAARGLILQRADGTVVWDETLPLLSFTLLAIVLALLAYRKRI
jgi:ABC-2 type transport system permease protein